MRRLPSRWLLVFSIACVPWSCVVAAPDGEPSSPPTPPTALRSAVERVQSVREWARPGTSVRPFALPSGMSLTKSAGRIEPLAAGEMRAVVSLPARADQPFRVGEAGGGVAIEVRLLGARAVQGELVDGVVVYAGAHAGGGDVFQRITARGTEDHLLLTGPSEVAYEVALSPEVAAVRQVGPSIELLDGSGDPRLRMEPPTLVDADGTTHEVIASISGCAVDTDPRAPWGRRLVAPGSASCRIALSWDAVRYPALLDPAWNATGDMMQDRYGHGMVTLPNGYVLAVGGSRTYDGSGMALSSCELWNPITGTWASTASLPTFSFSSTCFLVAADTKVFCADIFGGSWMYDIDAPEWTATGPMGESNRQGAALAKLADGRVLFVGGGNPVLQSAEIFDPAGNGGIGTFAATTSAPARARSGGGAALLADDTVIIAGGWNPTDGYMLQTEIFDPSTGGFTAGPPTNQGMSNGTNAVRLPDDRVLMQGGYGVTEIYDPTPPAAWTSAAAVPSGASNPGLLGMVSGGVLISVQDVNAFPFDSAMNDWGTPITQTARAGNGASYYGAIAEIAGGRLLLAGGVDTTIHHGSMKTTEILSMAQAALGAPCTLTVECTPGAFCVEGSCCSSACDGGCEVCDGSGTCATAPSGHVSPACGDYACQGAATCPSSCSDDGDCVATAFCNELGQCEPKRGVGEACAASSDCESALSCADSVCCASACDGQCESCDRPGSVGTCVKVSGAPIGRPACDGSGTCAGSCDGLSPSCVYPTTSCRAADCSAGVATAAASCDGAGSCPAASTSPCSPYHCNAAMTACESSCADDGDCALGHYCAASVCEPKQDDGVACGDDRECTSGTCADAVCCDVDCGSSKRDCRACSVAAGAAVDGTCATIAAAADHVCRRAVDACDIAETCSGEATCPADEQKASCSGSGGGSGGMMPSGGGTGGGGGAGDAGAAGDGGGTPEADAGPDAGAGGGAGADASAVGPGSSHGSGSASDGGADAAADAGAQEPTHRRRDSGGCSAVSGRRGAPGVSALAGLALLAGIVSRRRARRSRPRSSVP